MNKHIKNFIKIFLTFTSEDLISWKNCDQKISPYMHPKPKPTKPAQTKLLF